MYGPAAKYLLCYIGGVLLVTGEILPWWLGFGALLCLRKPIVFFFLACLLCKPSPVPSDLAGTNVLVKISDLPEQRGKVYRTTADILGRRQGQGWQEAKGVAQVYFPEAPVPGQIYEIPDGLKRLTPPRNSYEFDYSAYLNRQGIYYRAFLRDGDYVLKGKAKDLPWSLSARLYLHEVYLSYIGKGQALGIAEAMVSGMKGEVEDEVEQAYTATGKVHALAVSGMHVALLFWMLNLLLSRVLAPRSIGYMMVLIVAMWAYAIFTGLSGSVCRSVLMFSLFLIGDFLGRSGSSMNTLFISALLLLLLKPMWLFDVGFQLSYLAVWGIMEFNPLFQRWYRPKGILGRYLWESTTVTLSATLYTLPLTVYYFHQFPNYFLLANPLVNLICTPLLPLGLLLLLPFPALSSLLGSSMKFLIEVMNGVVLEMASWPSALTENISYGALTVFLSYGVVLALRQWLGERNPRFLYLGGICLFLVFIQEASVLIRSHQQAELVFHEQGFSVVAGRRECSFNLEEPSRLHRDFRREKGISEVETRGLSENFFVQTAFGQVIWLKKMQEVDMENATFVLISNEACPPDRLSSNVQVILDKTNSDRYVQTLKARGLNVINLREVGMKIIADEQTI